MEAAAFYGLEFIIGGQGSAVRGDNLRCFNVYDLITFLEIHNQFKNI